MLIGIDFDNTIVCYDELFSALAQERRLAPRPSMSKGDLRDHLRRVGREDEWTELQGVAYGPEIGRAKPFPGALEFLARCRRENVAVAIISHKTRHPYLGEKHDLHAAALGWLGRHGLACERVYLEPTKQEKLRRIAETGCSHFVDDLPEFLLEPGFPPGVERIWFSPAGGQPLPGLKHAVSWSEIERWIFS